MKEFKRPQQGTTRIVSRRKRDMIRFLASEHLDDLDCYRSLKDDEIFKEFENSSKLEYPEILRRLQEKYNDIDSSREVIGRAYRYYMRRIR